MASPSAAKSVWCEKEIQYWIQDKPPETIILVLLSGVIEWNSNTNDFNWNKTDSLPKSFKGVFSSEPRFVDLKNTDLLTQHKDITTRNKFAEIVSVLLGLPKDELIGEDIRLYRRTLKLAWGGMAILAVTSILATWQWYEATIQRDLAKQRLSHAIELTERVLFDIDEKLVGVAGAGQLRRNLTYEVLSTLIKLRTQAADNADLEWAQMVGYYQKGNLALRYGDLKLAETAHNKSLKIAQKMVVHDPGYIEPYHC